MGGGERQIRGESTDDGMLDERRKNERKP